jgi:hypothetical protein
MHPKDLLEIIRTGKSLDVDLTPELIDLTLKELHIHISKDQQDLTEKSNTYQFNEFSSKIHSISTQLITYSKMLEDVKLLESERIELKELQRKSNNLVTKIAELEKEETLNQLNKEYEGLVDEFQKAAARPMVDSVLLYHKLVGLVYVAGFFSKEKGQC